jgi:hypothetical protein
MIFGNTSEIYLEMNPTQVQKIVTNGAVGISNASEDLAG